MSLWEKFLKTGSVFDYIEYCRENREQKEKPPHEVHNARVDNKINEYR